jgi:hypothetical protein
MMFSSPQRGPGAQPGCYSLGIGAPSPGVKRQEREADHSPPTSAKVKNGGAVPPRL